MAVFSNLLILGNGFDLDLGFPSSYGAFRKDITFPFGRDGHKDHSLGQFILKAVDIHKWFDLENVFAEYGKYHQNVKDIDGDKADYDSLVSGFLQYLQKMDISNPKSDSVAARMLNTVCNCLNPPVIYTFNYTDLSTIGRNLTINVGPVSHIHGSIANNDIILGAGDYAELDFSTDYMYKTSNEKYRSTDLFQALDLCDNILIFGLSLSQVDYPYFRDFFTRVAEGKYSGVRKKYIRVFTKDSNTRMEILRNLRQMNSGMISLTNYADFDIVRTAHNVDEEKVLAIIDKLTNEWKVR